LHLFLFFGAVGNRDPVVFVDSGAATLERWNGCAVCSWGFASWRLVLSRDEVLLALQTHYVTLMLAAFLKRDLIHAVEVRTQFGRRSL